MDATHCRGLHDGYYRGRFRYHDVGHNIAILLRLFCDGYGLLLDRDDFRESGSAIMGRGDVGDV